MSSVLDCKQIHWISRTAGPVHSQLFEKQTTLLPAFSTTWQKHSRDLVSRRFSRKQLKSLTSKREKLKLSWNNRPSLSYQPKKSNLETRTVIAKNGVQRPSQFDRDDASSWVPKVCTISSWSWFWSYPKNDWKNMSEKSMIKKKRMIDPGWFPWRISANQTSPW